MNDDPAARVHELAAKLGEIAERLRDPEVADQEAAELAREAAEKIDDDRPAAAPAG